MRVSGEENKEEKKMSARREAGLYVTASMFFFFSVANAMNVVYPSALALSLSALGTGQM